MATGLLKEKVYIRFIQDMKNAHQLIKLELHTWFVSICDYYPKNAMKNQLIVCCFKI